jgi:hypothetical protein
MQELKKAVGKTVANIELDPNGRLHGPLLPRHLLPFHPVLPKQAPHEPLIARTCLFTAPTCLIYPR